MGAARKDFASLASVRECAIDSATGQLESFLRSRLPAWVFMYDLHGNPKWPDITAQLNRALLMRQKGRMLPLFFCIELFMAMTFYSGDIEAELMSKLKTVPPTLSFSAVRLAGAVLCLAGTAFLFFVSVFLEPPPDEDARLAVRATVVGPLLFLAHDVIVIQLVVAVCNVAAEISLAYAPIGWLVVFANASPLAVCSLCAACGILFWLQIKDDRQWMRWLEPLERAGTGAVEIEYLLHLGPFFLAWADVFVFKDTRMMVDYAPSMSNVVILLLVGTNLYVCLCHCHSLISGGHHLYPFLRRIHSTRDWVWFMVPAIIVINIVVFMLFAFVRLRSRAT
uniref:Transmembrane protein n=1 Tax=Pfiesteria piscicida TaxID=71001 RepID=A3E3S0_PFIPI|nr:unknown [Pfiesteria piscicida]